MLARLCREQGARRLAVAADLPEDFRVADVELVRDDGLSPHELDGLDGALGGCALAIAETGVIVLDGGAGQGRRALTLVPDYHLCVVEEEQIVDLVPEAFERLEPAVREGRPLTFVAGPSATSDIELNRVEGVHGPRTLQRGGAVALTMSFLVHAALTTPYTESGSLDLDALRLHVELLAEDGVDGVVPAGTTGEGPLLEESEVATAIATAIQTSAGRMEVIAHVGRAATPATVRLARAAAGSGADAVMAVAPYYFSHDADALLAHYRALLAALGDTPVLAYTFPARTHNELEPELLDTLAGEGLAGLKDSTGSPERLAQYLEVAARHEGFRLFSGSEALMLEAMRGGAAGSISALANVRADVLLALREEGSEEAQRAVDGAKEELPGIAEVKRAVAERLAERGAVYPPEPRAPLPS